MKVMVTRRLQPMYSIMFKWLQRYLFITIFKAGARYYTLQPMHMHIMHLEHQDKRLTSRSLTMNVVGTPRYTSFL